VATSKFSADALLECQCGKFTGRALSFYAHRAHGKSPECSKEPRVVGKADAPVRAGRPRKAAEAPEPPAETPADLEESATPEPLELPRAPTAKAPAPKPPPPGVGQLPPPPLVTLSVSIVPRTLDFYEYAQQRGLPFDFGAWLDFVVKDYHEMLGVEITVVRREPAA